MEIKGNSNSQGGQGSRRRALVIGGSIAGLVTARILSKHFDEVIILERDPVSEKPEIRKGQPQAAHTHVLLGKGFELMQQLFPKLRQELVNAGVEIIDFAKDARWFTHGGQMKPFAGNREYVMASRPQLEAVIRKLALANPNISLRDRTKIKSLAFDASKKRVTGVELVTNDFGNEACQIEADLVVDCSGRGSQACKWLTQIGYQTPIEDKVDIDVGYATRIYQRTDRDLSDGKMILVSPASDEGLRGGCLVPIEGDRWICTLSGWGGDHASTDESEFLEYCRGMASSSLYDSLRKLQPVSSIRTYKYPRSRWLRFDRLSKFPPGFLVLGDAVCSFNPIYGQGMTSTALQAEALDQELSRSNKKLPVATNYFRRAAKKIKNAWNASALGDYQYPTTKGKKPFGTDFGNWYTRLLMKASQHDSKVYDTFLRFTNLMSPARDLFHPVILFRLCRSSIRSWLTRFSTSSKQLAEAGFRERIGEPGS